MLGWAKMNELEQILGYRFVDRQILTTALTHISYANEQNVESLERYEFLGDAVIELVVTKYLFEHFDYCSVGVLAKLRAYLVSTDNLAKIATTLGLNNFLIKSNGLKGLSNKNLADMVESIIGAIFVDGGLDNAKRFIDKSIIVDIDSVKALLSMILDFKTKLQEEMQAQKSKFEYVRINSFGRDHEKTFEYKLIIDDVIVAKATGKSIQDAQENCAKKFLLSRN